MSDATAPDLPLSLQLRCPLHAVQRTLSPCTVARGSGLVISMWLGQATRSPRME